MFRKILVWIGAILALLLLGFAVVVAVQPEDFRVERSATMAASPDKVFAHVNDFHRWDAWSPWLELDPGAKTTFEGPTAGEGAVFRWSGNDQVGEGSMTIVESRPDERIGIELAFVKPMQDVADVEFTFQPDGERTKVSWIMSGKNDDFMSKAACLVMNMESYIGTKYEQGLANLKRIVEAEPTGNGGVLRPADEGKTPPQ